MLSIRTHGCHLGDILADTIAWIYAIFNGLQKPLRSKDGVIRTNQHEVKSCPLIERRAFKKVQIFQNFKNGRSGGIRTHDPFTPSDVPEENGI